MKNILKLLIAIFLLTGTVFAYERSIYSTFNFRQFIPSETVSLINSEFDIHFSFDDIVELKPLLGFSCNSINKNPTYTLYGGGELVFHPWFFLISSWRNLSAFDLYLRTTDLSKVIVGAQIALPFNLMGRDSIYITLRIENYSTVNSTWLGLSVML